MCCAAVPATKSALRGSPNAVCTSRFTKCCACHEICTHKVRRLPRNLHFEVHKVSTPRFTKCCTCHEICTSRITKSALRGSPSAAPATKTAFRTNTPPIPCTCHEKSTLEHEVSLAPATKSDHHVRKCAQRHNESAVARSTKILRACAVDMHFEEFKSHECAVNSSELAGHGCALQRSKHQLPFPHRKNPYSVSTLLGEKTTNYFTSSDPHHDISIICLDAMVRSMLPWS